MKTNLREAPTLFRATNKPTTETKPQQVDRTGGMYGAGLIRGMAVITRGEALGHDAWIDETMLDQVAAALAAAGAQGVKSRFTHPGLSSDGMGKQLGRTTNGVRAGDVVRGDLHLLAAAQGAPDGNLATFVMDLAEEDPALFGTSIVFARDSDAMELFRAQNLKDGEFVSPDPQNKRNLPHMRLKQLRAVDVVDDPAANPDGLFQHGAVAELYENAAGWVEFSLGLRDDAPEAGALGIDIDPTRVRGFVQRTLTQRGLALRPAEEQRMSTTTTTPMASATPPPADEAKLRLEGAKQERERFAALREKFPKNAEFASEMYDAGKSVAEAETEFNKREVARLSAENEALKKGVEQVKPATPPKVGFSNPENAKPEVEDTPRTIGGVHFETPFWEKVEALRAADPKLGYREAQSRCASRYPDLYAEHVETIEQQNAGRKRRRA